MSLVWAPTIKRAMARIPGHSVSLIDARRILPQNSAQRYQMAPIAMTPSGMPGTSSSSVECRSEPSCDRGFSLRGGTPSLRMFGQNTSRDLGTCAPSAAVGQRLRKACENLISLCRRKAKGRPVGRENL